MVVDFDDVAARWSGNSVSRLQFSQQHIKQAVSSTLQLALINDVDPKMIMIELIDGEWFMSVTPDD